MGISIKRTTQWWKSALAGILLPILITVLYPFIILLVFLFGIFGFISITKNDKAKANSNNINSEKNSKNSGTNENGEIEPEKITSILDKFKEIIIEMKKK
jgi:hypothetical protein